MLIERPTRLLRLFFPTALFRGPRRDGDGNPIAYLTFDDGPVPEVTPRVLDMLDAAGAKATFFMVGDNVRRHPELLAEVLRRGHATGNHSMHHLQGLHVATRRYLRDVLDADALIDSPLFRPPHGMMRLRQFRALKPGFRTVMYDLITRDYSRHLTPEGVVRNVARYARPGSVIVFHDSVKAAPRVLEALPRALALLRDRGYVFRTIHTGLRRAWAERPLARERRTPDRQTVPENQPDAKAI